MSGDGQMKKYPYKGAHTVSDVGVYISDFFEGNLSPSLKTEVFEPEDTQGDVTIVKGVSFADIVLNNSKDVLIEFYAPWCGHCKKLAPTWDELGKRLRSVENVVIAKMDATANEVDVPGLDIRGYPSIYFFQGNDKSKPVKYEAGREVDDFIEYLKKNGAHGNSFDPDEL